MEQRNGRAPALRVGRLGLVGRHGAAQALAVETQVRPAGQHDRARAPLHQAALDLAQVQQAHDPVDRVMRGYAVGVGQVLAQPSQFEAAEVGNGFPFLVAAHPSGDAQEQDFQQRVLLALVQTRVGHGRKIGQEVR